MAHCDTIKVNGKEPIPEIFTTKSEDSPEEINGGEKSIGSHNLCPPALDVATEPDIPPLHGAVPKLGRLGANEKMLEVATNRWVRKCNLTNFSNANTQARAMTVGEADSTEKQSMTWEYETLATMGKEEDFLAPTRPISSSVYGSAVQYSDA